MRPYLEIAVGIQQEIGGFEISMQYVCRMESFQGSEGLIEIKNISSPLLQRREENSPYLIDEILTMVITQLLCTYYTMKICLHQFLYEVDLLEIVETWRLQDINDCDDIFVVKVAKKLNLTESSKTEH